MLDLLSKHRNEYVRRGNSFKVEINGINYIHEKTKKGGFQSILLSL